MPRIHLSSPDVGPLEREYLLRAFDSGWVAPAGPDLDAFEREISTVVGWPGAVALSSGTAALHLALLVSGVRPGDDVLVSSFTFAATANAVVHCGANPVFIDSERTSWNMDPALLADALSDAASAAGPRVRPSSSTSTASAPTTTRSRRSAATTASLWWRTRPRRSARPTASRAAGTLGDIGVFSFNGNKVATTSGGGVLVTPDARSPIVCDTWRHRRGSRPSTSSTRGRVQLPPEQPAGCHRPRAAGPAAGDDRAAAGHPRPVPRAAWMPCRAWR